MHACWPPATLLPQVGSYLLDHVLNTARLHHLGAVVPGLVNNEQPAFVHTVETVAATRDMGFVCMDPEILHHILRQEEVRLPGPCQQACAQHSSQRARAGHLRPGHAACCRCWPGLTASSSMHG